MHSRALVQRLLLLQPRLVLRPVRCVLWCGRCRLHRGSLPPQLLRQSVPLNAVLLLLLPVLTHSLHEWPKHSPDIAYCPDVDHRLHRS